VVGGTYRLAVIFGGKGVKVFWLVGVAYRLAVIFGGKCKGWLVAPTGLLSSSGVNVRGGWWHLPACPLVEKRSEIQLIEKISEFVLIGWIPKPNGLRMTA